MGHVAGKSYLKIAHIDTEPSWRGGQQQVLSLIEGLQSLGHQNLAVVRRSGALSERLRGVAPLMPVRHWGEWDVVSAHFVNRRLKSENVDIVHAHAAHAAALAALATMGTNIPLVVTRRVDFPLSQNFFSRMKYARASRIVAISNGVKQVLLESGVEDKKITVVPSGVDFKKFSRVSPVDRKIYGFPKEAVIVGQVAALAPHKDQVNFLSALSILRRHRPQAHGVIVGEGALRATLEKRAAELGLSAHVIFLGFKNNPLDYLASFDVFCLSSKEEGLGTSLLDAMALKIPVVATHTGGIPELIQEGETGYLARPRDSEALASALERCLEGKSRHRSLLDKAAAKAREYDIVHTVSRMESLYKSILNQ